MQPEIKKIQEYASKGRNRKIDLLSINYKSITNKNRLSHEQVIEKYGNLEKYIQVFKQKNSHVKECIVAVLNSNGTSNVVNKKQTLHITWNSQNMPIGEDSENLVDAKDESVAE